MIDKLRLQFFPALDFYQLSKNSLLRGYRQKRFSMREPGNWICFSKPNCRGIDQQFVFKVYFPKEKEQAPLCFCMHTNPARFISFEEFSKDCISILGRQIFLRRSLIQRADFAYDLPIPFSRAKYYLDVSRKSLGTDYFNSKTGVTSGFIYGGLETHSLAIYCNELAKKDNGTPRPQQSTRIESRYQGRVLPTREVRKLFEMLLEEKIEVMASVKCRERILVPDETAKDVEKYAKLIRLQTLIEIKGYTGARRYLNHLTNRHFERDYSSFLECSKIELNMEKCFRKNLMDWGLTKRVWAKFQTQAGNN